MWSVSADGVLQSLSATLAIAQTSVTFPYSMVNDLSTSGESMTLLIQGLTGAVSLTESDSSLSLSNISLGSGASTLSLGAETLLSILFNDELGPLTLTLSAQNPDQPKLDFDPGMSLSLGTHFAPLVAEGEDIPAEFLDETYSIDLTGAAPSLAPIAATDVSDGAIEVGGGTLVLATDSDAAATVTVPSGQCLIEDPAPAPEAHPILGSFASGPCP